MKGYSVNNVKISYFGEPEFYINEKKRTVTCKLVGTINGPYEGTINSFLVDGIDFPTKSFTVTATARCHENDKFEVERGKRIALAKAENELYSQATLYVSEVCEKLDFMRKACDEFFTKSVKCQAHNIDYIDSLTMPAHPRYNKEALPRKRGIVKQAICNL